MRGQKRAHPFSNEKETGQPHPRRPAKKGCTVKEHKVLSLEGPAEVDAKSPLEQLITEDARKMLQAAIEQEIEDYLQAHRDRQTAEGRASITVVSE